MSLAIGGLSTYLKPAIGIPIFVVLLGIGIWLLIMSYKADKKSKRIESVMPKPELKIGAKVEDIKTAGYYDRAEGGYLEGDKLGVCPSNMF